MPKRVGYLFDRMLDEDFILRCIRIGTRDAKKRRRRDVRRVLDNPSAYAADIKALLLSREYMPRQPHHRRLYDASGDKWRDISSVPFFPDGLLHIMLVQAMMDVLMRGMSHWSCASVPGRGTSRVRKRIQCAMRKDRKGTKYALEMDIKSYYPSVPLDRLMAAFERKIKDREFLSLLALCLTCNQVKLKDVRDWREITHGAVGINIGFYLNQWAANYYLEPLDTFIYTLPGVKYVVRYMDNITILGANKRKLHAAQREIEAFLAEKLGLRLKQNWQVYSTRHRMVCAVGYRYAATHTILRKRNFLRLTRQCRRVQKKVAAHQKIAYRQAAGLLSRIGQLKHCNSYNLRQKYISPLNIKLLKEVIRNDCKRKRSPQHRLQR